MGSMSLWHWIIVALIVLILFGRGRISEVMGDFGKGITSFKKGLSEEEKKKDEEPARQIAPPPAAAPADTTAAATPER
ncbi:MAG TPA: twin-arginine translocase TatA/TatE family subunit, partial [Croceibacterium sp.]|nr:twin-arginine translocase TatA/TatE family subunit [Croceibacterium sp.]